MQLSFRIPVFEGPLDLLLHLIAKHKLNINDIPITTLVDQYLEYIGNMAELNMEIAGEFMEMAARLIYIKTVSLLPKYDEAETLKKELEGRLVEYSVCKQAAALLKERFNGGIVVKKPVKMDMDMTYTLLHSSEMLREAYLGISIRKPSGEPVTEAAFTKIVARRYVPVTAKIVYVLKRLYSVGKCSLEGLFEGMRDRSERVAAFLAVLELTKTGRILLNDENTEIYFNQDYSGGAEGEATVHSDFDDEDKPTGDNTENDSENGLTAAEPVNNELHRDGESDDIDINSSPIEELSPAADYTEADNYIYDEDNGFYTEDETGISAMTAEDDIDTESEGSQYGQQ